MDKPPPPLHTKKNELIDALKGEVPATGSSGDRGMGWDSWRVAARPSWPTGGATRQRLLRLGGGRLATKVAEV